MLAQRCSHKLGAWNATVFFQRHDGVNKMRRLMLGARAAFLSGGAQVIVQLAGFVSGILIIRFLSAEQYAYYTIATSALGVMTVLADGGVGNGVLALGGQVWQSRTKLGMVIAAGLALRRKLGLFAVVISVPLTTWLLLHQGAGWVEALLVSASVLPVFFATASGQLMQTVPRLHQHLLPLQRIQIGTNVGRAVLTLALVPLWPVASVASVIAALPQWIANWRLRLVIEPQADWRVPVDPEVRAKLVAFVQRSMPAAVYYALSGQLTVWLISIFGLTTAVAAVGALGRLAMILSAVSAVFTVIAMPRFARLPAEDPHRVWRRYWQSQTALAIVCSVPLIALAVFPGPALAVLGPRYMGLEHEVVLMAASSMVGMMSGAAYGLGAARGIVVPPLVMLPYCFASQVLLVLLLPVNTVAGVIWIGLLSASAQWLLHVAYFIRTSRRQIVGNV